MKKKYSKEFIFAHTDWPYEERRQQNMRVLRPTTRRWVIDLCVSVLCRAFKFPVKLIRNRNHRVRITIEFLEELK